MDTIYKIFRDEQKRVKRNTKHRAWAKRKGGRVVVTKDEFVEVYNATATESETKEVSNENA